MTKSFHQPTRTFRMSEAVRELQRRLIGIQNPALLEGMDGSYVTVAIPVFPLDVVAWLAAQKFDTTIFWSDREGKEQCAAVDCAHEVPIQGASGLKAFNEHLLSTPMESGESVRYYGGLSFDRQSPEEEAWHRFAPGLFWLPRFELRVTEKGAQFLCHLFMGSNAQHAVTATLKALKKLNPQLVSLPGLTPRLIGRLDIPTREKWQANITALLGQLDRDGLTKVVLARKTQFKFASSLNSYGLLQQLSKTAAGTYIFSMQRGGHTFLGASPERLMLRDGRSVHTEALAGTRPRGATPQTDKALIHELRTSVKEHHEHRVVVEDILQQLRPLCRQANPLTTEPEIIHLRAGHHMRTRITATLNHDVKDHHLLGALHPTPAVGGVPTRLALDVIRDLELFSRGWYAGPVGFLSRQHTDFCVAIRSGLLTDQTLTLYAGAGIVSGSDAQREWEEIENKLTPFLDILQQP